MSGETRGIREWRYEVRGSALYDLSEQRSLSIFEAGEILNAHQALLMKEGIWAAKAGLAESRLSQAEEERDAYKLRFNSYYEMEQRVIQAEEREGRLRQALEQGCDALIWASGCFQSEVEMVAWAKTGRPAVDAMLAILHASALSSEEK